MNEQAREWRIQRILVALDASRHSLAALKAVIGLASSLKADLDGLFVEDINLLRLAGSPLAREVLYPYVTTGPLSPRRMRRELRAQAEQARRSLAAACEVRQVKWSFRVVRGEVAPEILAAAQKADLLSLGTVSRPLLQRMRMGSTARAAAEGASCCVLLHQRDVDFNAPVVALYDDSPTAQIALNRAAHFAQNRGGHLVALLLSTTVNETRQLRARASKLLRGRKLIVRYRQLANADAATLTYQVYAAGGGMLVLGSSVLHLEELETLLDEIGCPVLLAR